MENKIRKIIKEQIKKLAEMPVGKGDMNPAFKINPSKVPGTAAWDKRAGLTVGGERALQVTTENGVVAIIKDPSDIEAYDRGDTVMGVTADGEKIELNIDWSSESHMVDESMSPEEWEAAKEAERLANHPEKEKIMKIKQMMDKEKDEEQEEWDKGWYGESLKELSSKLGYLNEDRQETIVPLDKLTFDMLKQVFSDNYKDVHFIRPQTGEPYYRDAISLPNWDDSSTSIGDTVALNHWKEEMSGHYGNVDILLKPEAENWFDKVEIIDDKYKTAKSKFIKGKMAAMQRYDKKGWSTD